MNIALLRLLRDARGEFLPLSALGSDPGAAQADVDELESFGFLFERHPYRGIAYRGPAPRLCPDQIEHALETRRVGKRIAVWNRVSSTNDLAARCLILLAAVGAGAGAVGWLSRRREASAG